MKYASIIFVQNPEYDHDGTPLCPVAQWLDNAWQGDDDSLVDYLAQWDNGEYDDVSDSLPCGTSDDTFEHGGYVVTFNRRLGYVGLCKPIDGGA